MTRHWASVSPLPGYQLAFAISLRQFNDGEPVSRPSTRNLTGENA